MCVELGQPWVGLPHLDSLEIAPAALSCVVLVTALFLSPLPLLHSGKDAGGLLAADPGTDLPVSH